MLIPVWKLLPISTSFCGHVWFESIAMLRNCAALIMPKLSWKKEKKKEKKKKKQNKTKKHQSQNTTKTQTTKTTAENIPGKTNKQTKDQKRLPCLVAQGSLKPKARLAHHLLNAQHPKATANSTIIRGNLKKLSQISPKVVHL